MDLASKLSCILLCAMFLNVTNGDSNRAERKILDFRKLAKVFVRYNIKVNVVPYTSIFAYAMGFRANWDVKPNTVIHPKRRVSASQHNSYYGSYLNPNNQNENVYYQNNQFQPNSYYRTVIQSAVQRAYEWHGLNGSACLQQSICEIQSNHEDDIISRILNIVFKTTEDFDCPPNIACPISLLQLIDHVLTGSHPMALN